MDPVAVPGDSDAGSVVRRGSVVVWPLTGAVAVVAFDTPDVVTLRAVVAPSVALLALLFFKTGNVPIIVVEVNIYGAESAALIAGL